MRKQPLMEYKLTPEEVDEAVLEYIARREDLVDHAKLRHVRYEYQRHDVLKKSASKAPFAIALTELPGSTEVK